MSCHCRWRKDGNSSAFCISFQAQLQNPDPKEKPLPPSQEGEALLGPTLSWGPKKKHPVFSFPRPFELRFKSQENLHYSTQKREPTAQHSALSEVRGPILTSDFCPFQSHTIFSLETSPSHQEDLSPFPAALTNPPRSQS